MLVLVLLFLFGCSGNQDKKIPIEIKYSEVLSNEINGIPVYKPNGTELSQVTTIPYKKKFFISESIQPQDINALKIPRLTNTESRDSRFDDYYYSKYDGLEGILVNSNFVKFDLAKSEFIVIETNSKYVYDSPFMDSNKIGLLNKWTIVQIEKTSHQWYEIKYQEKIGFIRRNKHRYKSMEEAQDAVFRQIAHLDGYLKLDLKNAKVYDKNFNELKSKGLLTNKVYFYEVLFSIVNDNKLYYCIKNDLDEYNNNKGEVFVDSTNKVFIPSEEILDYTSQNSKFKKDKKLLNSLESHLNLQNDNKHYQTEYNLLELESRYLLTLKSSTYYLITFSIGNLKIKIGNLDLNSNKVYLFAKKTNGNYTFLNFFYSYNSIHPVYKNGTLVEISILNDERSGTTRIYGIKDGEFGLIQSYLH
ncbi:MAG: hypothetical protein SFU98_04005 [Leptospiraceae bacterium]|nr:hypothetical protein [Leptospiraceae bacterium]